MNKNFPSIWIEIINPTKKGTLVAGFYRQWTHKNLTKKEAQKVGMNSFTNQIEKASEERKRMIIMGDANLCSS